MFHPSDFPAFRDWFAGHFSLAGEPYTLDLDQVRAVLDSHQNTLVTARAGSGKTRVIVAKIAYLLASRQASPAEIVAFMFNRAAAAEINQRIAQATFDGQPLVNLAARESVSIASTFHKFALDLLKLAGQKPQLISEADQSRIVRASLIKALAEQHRHLSPREFDETLKLISGFVARAGQRYSGKDALASLRTAVDQYLAQETSAEKARLHQLGLVTFENYLTSLRPPVLDFNLMLAQASDLLRRSAKPLREAVSSSRGHSYEAPATSALRARVCPLKYILIDEYQDFSQLFFNLVQALRQNCPAARLFAVGDDWQAINRFAGSDVDFFLGFAKYFPEDTAGIPLMTNYRSSRRVVEHANDYMLANYDPAARRAVPFSRKSGKIIYRNPAKVHFDADDIREDALGDGRYQLALMEAISNATETISNAAETTKTSAEHMCPATSTKLTEATAFRTAANVPIGAAKLLKTVHKILRRNRHSDILLLHRHNFTTFPGVTLDVFRRALQTVALEEGIMSTADFERQVRCMTIHKSKGLEAAVVILLEADRELLLSAHPDADLWRLLGDGHAVEKSDQHRLIYVAITRAKQKLYIVSSDRSSPL